jgi:hypothetical protein
VDSGDEAYGNRWRRFRAALNNKPRTSGNSRNSFWRSVYKNHKAPSHRSSRMSPSKNAGRLVKFPKATQRLFSSLKARVDKERKRPRTRQPKGRKPRRGRAFGPWNSLKKFLSSRKKPNFRPSHFRFGRRGRGRGRS